MKLRCKSCKKVTRHGYATKQLKKPRLIRCRSTGEIIKIEVVYVHACEICQTKYGKAPQTPYVF